MNLIQTLCRLTIALHRRCSCTLYSLIHPCHDIHDLVRSHVQLTDVLETALTFNYSLLDPYNEVLSSWHLYL